MPLKSVTNRIRALIAASAITGAHFAAVGAAQGPSSPQPLVSQHLANAFQVMPKVFSGGSPESDAAFAELRLLGVRTLISVDGARPNVAAARRQGIRYIHLPIGYDGISSNRIIELLQAAKSAEGNVYVHCHHGRHRGPAATAIIGQGIEGWTTNAATAWLQLAGTSPDYPGLFRSVAHFKAPPPEVLKTPVSLPEAVATPPLVEGMVALDHSFDILREASRLRWAAPSHHPDLSPKQAATMVFEGLRELGRTPDTASRPEAYRTLLTQAELAARDLASALGSDGADRLANADAAFRSLNHRCAACHKEYRNVP